MDSDEQLSPSTAIPIAQISPEFELLAESLIRATVTLVWPYSSSTKAFSFLLAEPDFRLRRSNGQVKVVFHGLVAERVVGTQVGIGDGVVLSLEGSRLEKNETAAQTPGRYVAWDAHFDDRVHLEVSRSSQHHSTVKIDPPVEPVQQTEVEPEPPVTPTAGRTRPEETDATSGLSSWASPAFVQRSRASFGSIVDTRFGPFAEEDGFVPGKGRKRPRFSMRSSEWRVVDEPASPGEKASPVDWTQELEDESVEPEGDGEGTTEDVGTSQEAPDITGPLPHEGGIPGGTTLEETAASANQPAPEISIGIEPPVEPDVTGGVEPTRQVNEKGDSIKAFHLPIDTPLLLPIPSPGLPVPSPLVSVPEQQQGYFASVASAAQSQTLQPRMTGTHSQTTIENDPVSEMWPDTRNAEAADSPAPERIDGDISPSVSESGMEKDVSQPAPTVNAETPEPMSVDEEPEQAAVAHDHEGELSPYFDKEFSVEEKPRIEDIASYSPEHIKIEEHEDASEDEEEGEEEDSQEEESDEEDELEEVMVEREEEEEEEHANQANDVQYGQAHFVERDPGGSTHAADMEKGPDLTTGNESDSVESQAEDSSESEEGYYIENQAEEQEDEDIYDEEPEEEHDGQEELVDSEMESDEDSDEQPYQVQAPQKNAQPEVIVLDSDDEDEQPDPTSHTHPPTQLEREESEASIDDQGPPEEQEAEDWSSEKEEEMEDEIMANGGSDDEQCYYYEDEDGHDQDEDQPAEDEQRPEKRREMVERPARIENERVEDEPASDEQEQGSPADDEMEVVDVATIAQHETIVRYATEEQLAGTYDEETHATEEFLQYSEPDIHEHVASIPQDAPLPQAVDSALYQFEASADDAVLNESQERVDQLSETPIERPPTATEPDQRADQGLSYDGSASPRLAHESPNLAFEPPDSLLGQQAMKPDTSAEIEASYQTFVTPEQSPEFLATSQLQDELPASADDSLVEFFGTPEEGEGQGPGSRSPSITEKDRLEVNEHAAHQIPHVRAVVGEDESLQLQDEFRARDGVSEEPETYNQQLPAPGRHYPGLRSKLSYFAPLATLVDHFHTLVDTMSVVHDTSPISQAAGGKKDYALTLYLTDPSLAGATLTAQLFRPYEEALPSIKDGDVILLRNFQVKSFNHSMILVSVDTSAWAVFNGSDDLDNENEAQMNGPPVEYGSEERSHATGLRQWYQEDGAAMVADNQLQASIQIASREVTPVGSVATSDSANFDSIGHDGQRGDLSTLSNRSLRRSRKSNRRITIHELRDGRRYAEVGSPSDRESIHELRDGTVYANL